MTRRVLTGASIFDGERLRHQHALVLGDGIYPEADVPLGLTPEVLPGGTILPGFVDLQANGGGGVMFNDDPSVHTLRRIAEAHHRHGTAALLPTLITDEPVRTEQAVDAVKRAVLEAVPGVVGLHLEGPHLSRARKGAHDKSLIRPMSAQDLALLTHAAECLPHLMVTVAPETVRPEQISALVAAGAVISLGHSDAGYDMSRAAMAAGATCTTHLFNAMSPLGHREPGLVGATLDHGAQHAGLIADGLHVHPVTIRAALAAKAGPGAVFLVTDAMSTLGSDITEFTLNGRQILRRDGRLTLSDGTLAGADLDMPTAVQVLVNDVGLPLDRALRMATSGPAAALGSTTLGRFDPDMTEALYLSPGFEVSWYR